MYSKFKDHIFVRFLVIMKNVLISFIKKYRGPGLRLPCDDRHGWRHHHEKYFFWDSFGRSFHIWGQIEAVINISTLSKLLPFWGRDKLFTGSDNGSWICNKIARLPSAFDRRCGWTNVGDISISKFDPLCDLVTSSMTSRVYN